MLKTDRQTKRKVFADQFVRSCRMMIGKQLQCHAVSWLALMRTFCYSSCLFAPWRHAASNICTFKPNVTSCFLFILPSRHWLNVSNCPHGSSKQNLRVQFVHACNYPVVVVTKEGELDPALTESLSEARKRTWASGIYNATWRNKMAAVRQMNLVWVYGNSGGKDRGVEREYHGASLYDVTWLV